MVLRSKSGITGGVAYCGLRLVQMSLYSDCNEIWNNLNGQFALSVEMYVF